MEMTAQEPYVLTREEAKVDLWWPFNPSGEIGRYLIKVTGDETQGRLTQMLLEDGRGAAPPLHIHHGVDETFYVISGDITVFVGDERFEAGPGDLVFGPRGVPHAYLVRSEKAVFLATFTPGGIEDFFSEVAVTVVPGKPQPAPAMPDPEAFARTAARFGIEVVGPPPALD